jgi:polyhydroxybutyrate depolymerase
MRSQMVSHKLKSMRVLRFASIVVAAAMLSGATLAAAESVEHTIDANGENRSYRVYVPPGQNGKHLAAFLIFHGSGSTAARTEVYTNFDQLAAGHDLAVVYPDGIDKHWNDGRVNGQESTADDVGFVRAMLAALTSDGTIDSKRVYATGISNGGFMSLHLACVMPEAIAGVGVIAADQPVDAACPSRRPMPAIFFHGTADKFVPFDGGPIAKGFGDRGTVLSDRETIAIWQKRNGCGAFSRTQLPAKDQSTPMRVTVEGYSCPAGQGLENVIIEGGGHTWPGAHQGAVITMFLGPVDDDIDANTMMWNFFQSQAGASQPR